MKMVEISAQGISALKQQVVSRTQAIKELEATAKDSVLIVTEKNRILGSLEERVMNLNDSVVDLRKKNKELEEKNRNHVVWGWSIAAIIVVMALSKIAVLYLN